MINRREFATAAVCGLSGLTAACRPKEDIIDIHQHLRYKGRSNAGFISHQKAMGITRSVLLPAASEMKMFSTHLGRSNGLAAGVSTTQAAADLAEKHPEKFVYF